MSNCIRESWTFRQDLDVTPSETYWHLPVGRGLLQSRASDVVVIKTPQGEEEWEVKKVEFLVVD